MNVVSGEAGGVADDAYALVGVQQTFRVQADGTTLPIVLITAYALLYGVTFFWFIEEATYASGNAGAAIGQKTRDVNGVCGAPHVQGFRSEQDQDPSGLLYNYGVITVGTDDLSITGTVRQRMDRLAQQATFQLIADEWSLLQSIGAH